RDRQRSELGQQSPAGPGATALGAYEQILEPDSRQALPGREARVEQREPRRRAVDLGDHRFGGRLRPEERLGELLHGAGDLIGAVLMGRELDDHRVDLFDVVGGGGPDPYAGAGPGAFAAVAHSGTGAAGTAISRLRILPVGPLGKSSTNQIWRG